MIVLGIHDGHGASACIMVDGELVALAAEERFSRLKNDHDYPYRAVDYCLSQVGIKASDLDQIAVASTQMNLFYSRLKALSSFDGSDWIRIHREYWKPKLYDGLDCTEVFESLWRDPRFDVIENYYDYSGVRCDWQSFTDQELARSMRIEGIRRHLGVPESKIRFYDHHACHAYYALFGSHIRSENTLIYTLDGGGDGAVSTLAQFSNGQITELARSNGVDIARLYRETTLQLGMKLGEHEYKVMGLAPYATEREFQKTWRIFDGMFDVQDDLICYADGRKPDDHYIYFRRAFEGHRFDGIAAAVQHMCETSVMRWFETTLQKYGSRNAVFAGGVAMNVKLNMNLADLDLLDDFYVCPSPTDDTLCVGACYMAETGLEADAWNRLKPISNPYMGPAYGQDSIRSAIEASGASDKYEIHDHMTPEKCAALLESGNVIARCDGRMEFGQRALGNRSILADPRKADTVEKINHKIKYRDFWMPFAPVVLQERAADYLAIGNAGIRRDYMMIGAPTTDQGQSELAAAIHQSDQTARPQVLSRESNPGYYDIIKAFEARTGTGALLNTSFNLHGEPIVCTPEDAISTFDRSELDVLVMGDVAISRNGVAE